MNKFMPAIILLLSISLFLAARPAAAAVDIAVKNDKGSPVEDAVVYLLPSAGKAPALSAETSAVMDQVNRQYVPRVLPVRTGTTVRFPNSDNILHHVYSFSPAKTFELPLYKGKTVEPILFDKPGAVVLGCNIHDWMLGYILVVDTPFFSKTGVDGKAKLHDVPPGDYKVYIWHPDLKDEKKTGVGPLTVGESGQKALEYKISVKPRRKPRQAPVNPGGSGY